MSTLIDENTDNEIDDEFNIADGDYGFLIDSDGNLKTVFGPSEMFGIPPKSVQKILKIFGINSSSVMCQESVTLH